VLQRFTTDGASVGLLVEIKTMLERAFDGRFDEHDWQHALGGEHVVDLVDGVVVAHGSVVRRRIRIGERWFETGYVEPVATDPAHEGRGHGSRVMAAITGLVHEAYDLGALSTGSPEFYRRLGWESWEGPSYVLDTGAARRTADEDDGIVVLRCAASRTVDLSAPITCEARPGDDW
jgi:aminoglycoside 2'-N-acetyltransferase I